MTLPYYATVEQLQAATDQATTAYETGRLKRLLDAASRRTERRLHRHFYPLTATVTYTDPPLSQPVRATSTGFWLDRDLLALTAVTADDTTVTVSDVELYPTHYGPPYSWVGQTGSDIDLTGRWGYTEDTETAGTLSAAIADTTGTTVSVSDSSAVGVGDLILVDSEQMVVTAKSQVDTTDDLAADLTADVSDTTVTVGSGSSHTVGEIILIDSERMLIVDITGNDLTVKRAYDGSVLATHDGTSTPASVYAPRTLTVTRGAVGTTAATHSDSTTVYRNVPPAVITELVLAEALTGYAQETAGYARVVGSGDNQRESSGAGLKQAREEADHYKRPRLARI